MAKKKSSDKKTVTDLQARWLNGERLLDSTTRTQNETMQALSLLSNALGQCEALWAAHGNPATHFWKPGMKQPITRDALHDHENEWLFSAQGDGDNFGAESYFVWKHFSDEEKQALWAQHPEPALYKWNADLRRPIPIDANENDAINSFLTIGPFCC
jgi:hypothetical protein